MSQGNYEVVSEDYLKLRHALNRAAYEEGYKEGFAEGQAEAVLGLLEARGIPITDEARARICTCKDTDTLDRWIDRTVTVTSADELFRE